MSREITIHLDPDESSVLEAIAVRNRTSAEYEGSMILARELNRLDRVFLAPRSPSAAPAVAEAAMKIEADAPPVDYDDDPNIPSGAAAAYAMLGIIAMALGGLIWLANT